MNEKIEPIALVDMDNTLCDYRGALNADLDTVLGADRGKLDAATLRKVEDLIRNQSGWYTRLQPLPLGFAIVDMLKDIGFEIMILTKANTRFKNPWSEKVEWVAKHLPGAKMTITEDKGLVYGKVLVDDWTPYVERWLQWRPRGLALMPDQPWNQEFRHEQAIRVTLADGLTAIRGRLEEAYRR